MGVPFSKGKITGFAAGTPDLLETQASAVSDTCNLWVPRYNQVGMLSLSQSMPGVKAKNIQKFKAAMALAYDDLAAAFRAFLANRPDKKRPFIILAHSQGSILMVKVSPVPREGENRSRGGGLGGLEKGLESLVP